MNNWYAGTTPYLRILFLGLCVMIGTNRLSADDASIRLVDETVAGPGMMKAFRDASVTVTASDGVARLAPFEYRGAWLGNRISGKVKFSRDLWGKVSFDIGQAAAHGAEVYVYSLQDGAATWNGKPLAFNTYEHSGGWRRALIDAAWLRAGVNELVMSNGFLLAQDADAMPARHSLVSTNGGAGWSVAKQGEFLVRLRLLRHPATGTIHSDVIDMAGVESIDPHFIPRVDLDSIVISKQGKTPAGTACSLKSRSGTTPRPDASWSDWNEANPPARRYVQWQVTLATTDPLLTPELASVRVEALGTVRARAEAWGATLVNHDTTRIVRTGLPYRYQRPSEKLQRLRTQFRLDEVVAAGKTDFERLILLRNWVRRQWPCNDDGSGVRTWDAIEILQAGENQHGMCVHFATVFYQCALALGYNARPVILTNHFVADVWSDEHRKWILMDVESVQREGFKRYGTAHYVRADDHTPLGLLELHHLVQATFTAGAGLVTGVVQRYTVDTNGVQHAERSEIRSPDELRIFKRFALPERNDFLDQLEPWEVMHGMDYYRSDAHIWWLGVDDLSRELQFSRVTEREGDLFWTVNEVQLSTTTGTRPNTLEVLAATVTPNFKCFSVRFDAGPWNPMEGTGDDPDERLQAIEWPLHPGENRLAVRSVNRFGREGRPSEVVVHLAGPVP
ncbi:MAG: hypothetical protein A2498_15335 [Lentisphaerae bacterium RIFOXYC12_FULL_60_16]|nr:MAG: hypothetical protein A2498_15335 [Lentisphaerae bacterium RIFOXYC12_FULL_60_16]